MFSGAVKFKGVIASKGPVTFKGTVAFNGAVVSRSEVKFKGVISSKGAVTFKGIVAFIGAVMSKGVVRFKGTAVMFKGEVRFKKAPVRFRGAVRFKGASVTFRGTVRFKGALVTLRGAVRFKGGPVTLRGAVWFKGALNAHNQERALAKQRKGVELDPGLFCGLRPPNMPYYYNSHAGVPEFPFYRNYISGTPLGLSDHAARIQAGPLSSAFGMGRCAKSSPNCLNPDFKAYNGAFVPTRSPVPPSALAVGCVGSSGNSTFQQKGLGQRDGGSSSEKLAAHECHDPSGLDLTLRL
ncbi:hypothetical protein MLD38_040573 [Melastoma candidum]|nr:hypothetical protein MLD38_040573 [Melastoma candidum]